MRNVKQAERLEAERIVRGQITRLEGTITELQAAKQLYEQQKTLELERLKTQLEGQIAAERSRSEDLSRRVNDHFSEISDLRTRNTTLETELAKVGRMWAVRSLIQNGCLPACQEYTVLAVLRIKKCKPDLASTMAQSKCNFHEHRRPVRLCFLSRTIRTGVESGP